MCEMTTALMALSIASSAASVYGQQQAANAQESANQRQYQNIMQARAANINQTNLMQQQERESAMQRQEDNNLRARAAKSTAAVSAGESGISGLSVDALLADLGTQQNRFNTSVDTNFDRTTQAIAIQRDNASINAASQINQLKTPAAPDYLGAALRIGQAVDTYRRT
jgi:hypothetical protein